MKRQYLRIPIDELTNGTVMSIAEELGCPIEYPDMERNKYMAAMIEDRKDGDRALELEFLFDEEQIRINQEFGIKFSRYMSDLTDWLVDNGYFCK